MQRFEPSNPAFAQRVRESFARQQVMGTLGASLTVVEPGVVEIDLPFRQDLTQQHGFLHAGIIATICDSACGYAAFTLMAADASVLSIEYKINLLAPAQGERFIARGSVTRPGRTITATEGTVFACDGGTRKQVAAMLATMMTVRGREDVSEQG